MRLRALFRLWGLIVVPVSVVALIRAEGDALKELVPASLRIGAALNQRQVDGLDKVGQDIVTRHFNTITSENLLKWALVHPEPDRYEFGPSDRYVAFGEAHSMFIVGHTLIWHRQTPDWVFVGADGRRADRDTLLARMRSHIQSVVGRYRGRIHGWDVVNEAFEDDGTWRKTPWLLGIGEDYVEKAFEYAREADPGAQLYYNDFNLWKPAKRAAALRLATQLRRRGLRIDGVGEQGHWLIDAPAVPEIEATILDIARAGFTPMITELDIDVLPRNASPTGAEVDRSKADSALDPYRQGLPPDVQQRLARRYADVFALFARLRAHLPRVTFWGVTDGSSWLNNFPIRGRTNHPLLWDREGRPKPAFDAVVEVLRRAEGRERAPDRATRPLGGTP
jgi:endo-1,4-beta-xylanase